MDNISDTDEKDAITEGILSLIPWGGLVYNTLSNVLTNLELDNKVTWKTWVGINEGARSDLYDSLGGEYTMSTFQIQVDKERQGSDGEIDEDDSMTITGVMYYGEPVILEDGTVIDDPNNFVTYTTDLEAIDPDNPLQKPYYNDTGE